MDNHLSHNPYFTGTKLTIADLALYASAHLAGECDFDLSPFAHVRAWLARVVQAPGFVPMDWCPNDPATHSAAIPAIP
jgi:glutathione S-transferase